MSAPTNLDVEFLQTPSKYDIIPVHASDRAQFRNCRRAWAWSSPSRDNLIPKASVHGIREPLWFGTGIHHALERYYNPRLQEDPVIAWQTWFDLQWNGGIVRQSELKEFRDHDPEIVPEKNPPPDAERLYRVKGLRDILFDPDPDHFAELRDTGSGMMEFYKGWAPENDNFTVVATEHEFSIPILTPEGEPLYMVDTRELPENHVLDFSAENIYGPLILSGAGTRFMKQVHARGRMDLIVQDNETGKYGILDFKSTARLDEDYFRHVDLDPQISSYLSLGQVEAMMHDFPYKDLEFCIYRAILKNYPKPPTILQSGFLSVARSTESTTAAMFEQAVTDLNLQDWYASDEKAQSYLTWLMQQGDKRFIDSQVVLRNKHERAMALSYLYYEAVDMLSDPRLYPNPRKEYLCLNCIFRGPCIAANSGQDWKAILEDGYMPNYDR